MARKKNALRQHYIAPYTTAEAKPTDAEYLRLAKWVTDINDDSEENTDTAGDYAGDGSEEEILLGRSEKWTFEGTYDPEDPAHKLIHSMKRTQSDEERLLWHKIIEENGDTVEGVAKALEIKSGGGTATEYGVLSGRLDFVKTPTITPAGTGSGE
ncbi:phage tail tube protein [Enterococcus diestrammenae]|uniref:phage tail tube protein n=1 Tax=Enterococcus diestrammenae TaxID=1155073 RepID=UPI0022E3B079|nr:phage tail protein [Enterococcus diestrammenae]